MSNNFIKTVLCRCKAAGKTIAFDIFDGVSLTSITYEKFLEDILAYTGYFMENGIKKQHIALIAPNCYEWVVAFYGIIASGNAVVPLNSELSEDILLKQIKQSDASLVCCDIETSVKFSPQKFEQQILRFSDISYVTPIQINDLPCADEHETILLMFTSGTTGKSKLAEFSASNVECLVKGYSENSKEIGTQRYLALLPMHHIAGITSYAMVSQYKLWTVCIGRGSKYVFMDMPVLNPTMIQSVPELLNSIVKILKQKKVSAEKYLGNSLENISVGGAMVSIETIKFLHAQGFRLSMGYAMTESCGAGFLCDIDINYPLTIGKPNKNVQCRIQDGEILLKSDAVMKGYYKDPEETARVLQDGWLHTGDLGYCDEHGNYYITGRKKNTIILSNGENVNPEEIEATWGRCDAIQECLVYADDKGICADVYASDKDQAAQFINAYNESVPRYHQVYKVFYSESPLEKTSSGKLKRKAN